jgi:2-succinyl-5-enolpyruvyl-6-hydroxy-3-cyclohexene-1-carboxylate synthase
MPVRNDNPVDYSLVEELNSEISQYQKILFLVGATRGESLLNEVVALLAEKGVVVVTETLSNLSGEKVFENTDRLLEYFSSNVGAFCPDLLITLDVPVLSKRIKQLIRSCHPGAHWHFSNQDIIVDTYQCLTRQIRGDALPTLKAVSEKLKPFPFGYMNFWEKARLVTTEKHREFCAQVAWSDFKVFEMLSQSIPDGVEIHLGNSTPVRYAQLFEWKQKHIFEGNRGTSGIDGCVSTAAGAAFAGDRPVTLIVGDLSFLYDSNGLWHRYLPATFRVIVINNGGGGIFRYIPGPSETKELEPFFEAKGDYRCKGIAETFGLLYFTATNADELMNVLSDFWEDKGAPALLEIFTPGPRNGEILRGYFNYLRSD